MDHPWVASARISGQSPPGDVASFDVPDLVRTGLAESVGGTVLAQPAVGVRRPDDLIYFHEVDRGGHFAAWEQPELFAAEIRAAFRSLR
jgi:pimeloyl-ACP methyl ester carboxylesterase